MENKDLDPVFLQSSYCTVPGCFSQPVFAGLCNLHSTKGIQAQGRRKSDVLNNAKGAPTKVDAQGFINDASSEGITQTIPQIPQGELKAACIGHDRRGTDPKMSFKYPKYYKEIPAGVTELDIYMVCHIFQVQDYSGAIHHAIKKLLLPGIRTGGKSRRDDIKEARDTLTRWLELNH